MASDELFPGIEITPIPSPQPGEPNSLLIKFSGGEESRSKDIPDPRQVKEAIYQSDLHIQVSGGIFDILQVRVTSADDDQLKYLGDLTFRDNLEHGVEGKDGWIATPGPYELEVFGKKYDMDIIPTRP